MYKFLLEKIRLRKILFSSLYGLRNYMWSIIENRKNMLILTSLHNYATFIMHNAKRPISTENRKVLRLCYGTSVPQIWTRHCGPMTIPVNIVHINLYWCKLLHGAVEGISYSLRESWSCADSVMKTDFIAAANTMPFSMLNMRNAFVLRENLFCMLCKRTGVEIHCSIYLLSKN